MSNLSIATIIISVLLTILILIQMGHTKDIDMAKAGYMECAVVSQGTTHILWQKECE